MRDILPPEDSGGRTGATVVKNKRVRRERTSARKQSLVEKLASASEEVAASISEISSATEEAKRSAQTIASAAEEAARSTEENRRVISVIGELVNKGLEEAVNLQAIIQDLNKKTTALTEMIDRISKSMLSTSEKVGSTTRTVEIIEKISGEIEDATGSILKVADRINLLALNAAIEAAKAGEHGKGFSVVAEEVRIMTELSEKNTSQIREIISELTSGIKQSVDRIANLVEEGRKQVDEMKEVVNEFNAISQKMADLIIAVDDFIRLYREEMKALEELKASSEQVASASAEQSSASEEISRSVSELSVAMDQINSAAEELRRMAVELRDAPSIEGKVAEEIASAAEELSASVEQFSGSIDQVKEAVDQLSAAAEEQARSAEGMLNLARTMRSSSDEVLKSAGEGLEAMKKASGAFSGGLESLRKSRRNLEELRKGLDGNMNSIRALRKKASSMSRTIGKIELIMVQTNMLSVNGFIESARSGEFGKGFEVVSSDIKNLALEGNEFIENLQKYLTDIDEQFDVFTQILTLSSAETLSDMEVSDKALQMTSECVDIVNHGVELFAETERGAKEILEKVDGVVSASEQIASAAEESARTTSELAKAIAQIEDAVKQIAQAIDELAGIADELQTY